MLSTNWNYPDKLFRRLCINWNYPDNWFRVLSMHWNCLDNWFRRLSTSWNRQHNWFRKRSINWNCPDNEFWEVSTVWKLAARATIDLASRLQYHAIISSLNRVEKFPVHPILCKVLPCMFLISVHWGVFIGTHFIGTRSWHFSSNWFRGWPMKWIVRTIPVNWQTTKSDVWQFHLIDTATNQLFVHFHIIGSTRNQLFGQFQLINSTRN